MALVSAGPFLWPDPNTFAGFASLSSGANSQINGSGQRIGLVFPVPASGTITKLGIRVSTCASAVTSRLGLYTVDSSGNPTSTTYGGSTYQTFTPAANTYSEVTLGTPATATAGDVCAWVVEFDSTAGDMFVSVASGANIVQAYPTLKKFNGSSWSSSTASLVMGHIYYSDGGGYYGHTSALYPATGAVSTGSYNVNTAGSDEYAIKLTVPFRCRVAGIWSAFSSSAGGDFEAILYSGTTALKTAAMDADAPQAASGNPRRYLFASGQTVDAGDTVRAAIRPTTTTSNTWRSLALHAAGAETAFGLPSGSHLSTRLDQGAWSDSATTTLPAIGLIVDQLDDGASAGSAPAFVRGQNTLLRL